MKKIHKVILLLAMIGVGIFWGGTVKAETQNDGSSVNYRGKYFYSNGVSTYFSGTLWRENGSNFGASCVDENGPSAMLQGYLQGNSIYFIKTYDVNSAKVKYSGVFVTNNRVEGMWTVGNNSGAFYMVFDW